MAFRKDKTGVAQTAANTAATLVSAYVAAGLITEVSEATAQFDSIRAATFADLEKVVDADNEVFAAAEAAAPAQRRSGGSGGGSKGSDTPPTLEQALATRVKFGKFAGPEGPDGKKTEGLSLAEIVELTGAQCAEYGHGDGDKTGLSYITWMSKNQDNPKMAAKAALILEARKASSAE